MTSAGVLDNEEESFEALSSDSDMFADRSESTTSSDAEFFSFEEDLVGSDSNHHLPQLDIYKLTTYLHVRYWQPVVFMIYVIDVKG